MHLTLLISDISGSFIRFYQCILSPHVRESKIVLDSGFHAMDSGFQACNSILLLVELGFRIPIFSEIKDSLSCIPDSKAHGSGFHKQNFPGFRIPNENFSESGIRIPLALHGADPTIHWCLYCTLNFGKRLASFKLCW